MVWESFQEVLQTPSCGDFFFFLNMSHQEEALVQIQDFLDRLYLSSDLLFPGRTRVGVWGEGGLGGCAQRVSPLT